MNSTPEAVDQGSAEWLFARVGYITCSRFADVLDRRKDGKAGAKRTAYLWEVVTERITNSPSDHYVNTAMQWGTDHEPASRMAFEAITGQIVQQVGFLRHPDVPMVGGSPDGLIDDDGVWESKSPFNSTNHLATWVEGMPQVHAPQVQGLLWITGRQYCVFQSYDPRMPESLQVYMQSIKRDDSAIAQIAEEVAAFQQEASELESLIRSKIQ